MEQIEDEDPASIMFNDWFDDAEGRTWSVDAVNLHDRSVRLHLIDPPTVTVSIDDLLAQYKPAGMRKYRLDRTTKK